MSVATATQATTTYRIDPAHSEVAFQVRHLLTRVRGRFSQFEGTFTYDDQEPGASSVEVTIQSSSIDTNEPSRDEHLRSADFFDVDQYPTLTFRGTQVRASGPERLDVTGDLTIHGVTRPVTLAVAILGRATDPWGNEKLGFEAETTINRKDFGLTWNAALETGGVLVGDEVRIQLSIQAAA